MGFAVLTLAILAANAHPPLVGLAEVLRLQRTGHYGEAWDKVVALYDGGRRDAAVTRTLQSLGLRLGKHDELLSVLRLTDDRELSFPEELLRAEILIRQGDAAEGLRILEGAVGEAGPASAIRAIALLTGRGMVEDALRLAQEQRKLTTEGDRSWKALTREIVSLSCEAGSTAECLREAFALVAVDSLSFTWAATRAERVTGTTRDMVFDALGNTRRVGSSRRLAARLLSGIGRPADGLSLLTSDGGVRSETFAEYGGSCLAQEDYGVALEAFAHALGAATSRSDTLAALEGLMTVRSRSAGPREAADWAGRLLSLDPSRDRASEAHLVLARASLASGDVPGALAHAREAYDPALKEHQVLSVWIEAEALLIDGRIAEADSLYRTIARTWPADTLANDCLARVTVLEDSCPGIRDFARGVGFIWTDERRNAAEAFTEAALSCRDGPLRCEAYIEASRSLFRHGDLHAAESLLRDAADDSLCTAKSLLWLARVLVKDGRPSEASLELERLLLEFSSSPMVIPARRELARLRSDQGQ